MSSSKDKNKVKSNKNLLSKFKNDKKNLSIMEEERIFSPGRTAFNNFCSKKLSLFGVFMFSFVFLFCMLMPFLMNVNIRYTDTTQLNVSPGQNMMSYPKQLDGNVAQIDAGSTFGVGIDNNGQLYQWGVLSDRLKIVPENMGKLVRISAGQDHAVAVNDEGEVFAWGNNRLQITNIPPEVQNKNIVQLEAGFQVTVALDDEGRLYHWGNPSLTSITTSGVQGEVQKFALNTTTALVLLKDGTVKSLISSLTPYNTIPASVQGRAVDIASTDKAAAVILDDGTVVVWGTLDYDIANIPAAVQGNATEITGGRNHFNALLKNGTVVSWGDNYLGQASVPKKLTNVVNVYTGYFQNYAVDSAGKIHTWGLKGYLMGTDHFGRDVFERIVIAGRISLTIGAIAVIIQAFLGILIGGFAGFYGGKIDTFLMRMSEVVQSIPLLPLAIILSALIGNRIPETGRVAMIMIIIGFLSWPGLARLTRASIITERENEFVTAAKAMGIKEGIIIFKHILPNILAVILVNITLGLASSMLTEASLSFIGFGVLEPTPTWGNMLNNSADSIVIQRYWWRWVFPSIALALCTISINIIGDGMRDAIDPKSNDR